jgi:hypothetical protein
MSRSRRTATRATGLATNHDNNSSSTEEAAPVSLSGRGDPLSRGVPPTAAARHRRERQARVERVRAGVSVGGQLLRALAQPHRDVCLPPSPSAFPWPVVAPRQPLPCCTLPPYTSALCSVLASPPSMHRRPPRLPSQLRVSPALRSLPYYQLYVRSSYTRSFVHLNHVALPSFLLRPQFFLLLFFLSQE